MINRSTGCCARRSPMSRRRAAHLLLAATAAMLATACGSGTDRELAPVSADQDTTDPLPASGIGRKARYPWKNPAPPGRAPDAPRD